MTLKINWKHGPGYPVLTKGGAAGVIDGKLLVVGGMTYPWFEVNYGFWLDTGIDSVKPPAFMPAGDRTSVPIGQWQPLPPLPAGAGWTTGLAVAGGLAVVGGRRLIDGKFKAIPDVSFLDVEGGATSWIRLPDRPTAAGFASNFADGDYLYSAFGGEWVIEFLCEDPHIYRMDVRKKTGWEVVTKFPGKLRWSGGFAICNGKLYVICGHDIFYADKDFVPNPNYGYLKYDGNSNKINEVYCDMWEYDLKTGVWKELPPPPRAFNDRSFTVADRWIVQPGACWVINPGYGGCRNLEYYDGRDNYGNVIPDLNCTTFSSEVWAYDTYTGKWQELDRLPYGIGSFAVATWQDRKVYLVGNEALYKARSNSLNTVFEGDIEITES